MLYSVILVKIARGREFGKSCFILDFACHTITIFKLLKICSAKHGESKGGYCATRHSRVLPAALYNNVKVRERVLSAIK